jgi:predicted ATP-grasp superfamily ATP-dependent carboligase
VQIPSANAAGNARNHGFPANTSRVVLFVDMREGRRISTRLSTARQFQAVANLILPVESYGANHVNSQKAAAIGETAVVTETAPRVLLSEGSSLSAREAITAVGLAGYRIELVSRDPSCLGRFSRFVDQVHPAPASGSDPDGYLAAVLDVVARRSIDVLMPVHEQAYLFAAARHRLPKALHVALADFAAFEQVQSKTALATLLTRLDVPQPTTEIVRSARNFEVERTYPYFVKAAFGTASTGVWRVGNAAERDALTRDLQQGGAFDEGVVVQAAAEGPLERTQAVFDHGRLVANHIYRQVAAGPGGGDVIKASVRRPEARAHVERIGAALDWHGALSFDYIVDAKTGAPLFFDANPRLVEPMNAWLSGLDLPGALLGVSLGEKPPAQPEGREGVITRLGLMGLMDAASRRGRRGHVFWELALLASNAGRYRGAIEELVPLATDPLCVVPLAIVLGRLLTSPTSGSSLSNHAVDAYSLTPAAIARLRAWAKDSDLINN